ncbi:MAG TPA: iron-sulfur cluster assembly scaffold protein [Candidatus Micrarchaeota archaeon]|nr:iron-sulfur cluster assembly scaffold protein [Candidatus Micrarchaeota archaeon]
MASVELYREIILDNYKNPLNRRMMQGANARAIDANPLCGDQIQFMLKIRGGKIIDASFLGEGCAISIAIASMLTEWAKGKTEKQLLAMEKDGILDMLGGIDPGPSRIKCALLPLKAMKMAIVNMETRKARGNAGTPAKAAGKKGKNARK